MRIAVALLTAVSISAFALAQDAPPFPVVNDLPEGWELSGGGGAVDVVGISVGMPREAAEAAVYSALEAAPGSIKPPQQKHSKRGKFGTSVDYTYFSGFAGEKRTGGRDGQREAIRLTYTTGVSGERVLSAMRTLEWPHEETPNLSDILAALTEKYGEPSVASHEPHHRRGTLFWVYANGQKVTYPTEAVAGEIPHSQCPLWEDGWSNYSSYWNPPSMESVKDCAIVIEARYFSPPKSDELVKSLTVQVRGPSRAVENYNATDAFMSAEVSKKEEEATPEPSKPKL